MRAPHDTPSPSDPIAPGARRTAFTMAGVLYGLTTLFLAVGAVNGQNNLLFWAFGMALGGLLVSGVFSGAGLMGLRLRRELAGTARAGDPLTLRYHVENANRLVPLYCVTFTEQVAAAPGTKPGRRAPSASVAFMARSSARSGTVVVAPNRPMRRGRLVLSGVTASSSFPLGLMRKSLAFALPATVTVLPARLDLRDDLVPRPTRRGHGGAASPTGVGHADEFFGVREYIPGDSPRLIAWRPSARGDTLVVRQQGTPPPTVVWIVLDTTGDDEPLDAERAIALAGSLIELLASRGCSVGLKIERAGISRLPATGSWHARRLLVSLATLDLAGPGVRGDDRARAPVPGDTGAPGASRALSAGIRREHAAIVVHGRSPARGGLPGAPPWASHVWASQLESYLAPGARIPDALSPPPPPETAMERRRRWVREFFMIDPVGEEAMAGAAAPVGPPPRAAGAPA